MKVIFLFIRKLLTIMMQAWLKKPAAAQASTKDKPALQPRLRPAIRQAEIYSFEDYIKEKKQASEQARSIQPKQARAVPDSDPQRPPRNSREEWQIRSGNRKLQFRSSA